LTKCFSIPHDEVDQITYAMPTLKDTRDYVNQGGLTRAAIFDLLQIHRADLDNATAEETMKALHDLVQSGKVRYIGASSMYTWQLAHYNHVADKVPF
jgi:aryl-alcohol dehydrogenase-like predicted oxidoreductase